MVNMQRHVPDQMLVPNGTRNWLMQNLFSIMLVLMAARAVYLLLFPSRDQIDLGYEIHRLMRRTSLQSANPTELLTARSETDLQNKIRIGMHKAWTERVDSWHLASVIYE
eukprot:3411630-Rhodomonas_salina.2